VVEHVVFVQETVVKYSKEFLLKLRRVNYVTPKNYLDFINTYNKLLEEKDKYVLEQVLLSWLKNSLDGGGYIHIFVF
jgi:dynein heavy chain